MVRFSKKEINNRFVVALTSRLRSGRHSWRVKGKRFGVRYDDGLWVVMQLQSSMSPTQAGFRATIGVGSERIQAAIAQSDTTMPAIHIGQLYEPSYYPEGLGTVGNAWMVMTTTEHASIHSELLGVYVEKVAGDWMRLCPNWERFAEELVAKGSPYFSSLLPSLVTPS